jgi:adenylate kinase family enzyme
MDVVVSVVANRIDHSDAANGFILDGFPRTLAQAQALDQELKNRGIKLSAVLDLAVDETALLDRIRGRAEAAANIGEPVRRDLILRFSRPGWKYIARRLRRSQNITGQKGCSILLMVCSRLTS